MASDPISSWQIDGETVEKCQTLYLGAPKSLLMVLAAMKLKDVFMTNLDSIFKSRDITFANKGLSGQGYGFSSGRVWM